MSAEQSRLRSAIQRIAREDPEPRGAIDAAKSRGDQPGGAGVGESGAERDRICCDGSTNPDNNPGADTRDPAGGEQDGLDPSDPANISDNVDGLVDCATGEPVCWEGGGLIPPEGWEDGAPPIAADYDPRYYWRVSWDGNQKFFQTCSQVTDFIVPLKDELGCDPDRGACCNCTPRVVSGGNCPVDVHLKDCEAPDQGGHPFCDDDAEPPRETEWPSDGCVNLAIVNGSIVGSKYDPENDGSYSAPRDEIELCDLETGDRTLIRVDTGGTWKSIKSLDGDIDPDTGYGYLYDAASGKKIRQISPSEFRDDMV